MKTFEFEKFRKNWINRLEKMFWEKFQKKDENISMSYMFDFCSLNSDVRSDEFGQLFLCYIYEKRKESENNILLKNIFLELFDENNNEKYLAFYKSQNNNNFREIMMALFLLGNEIEDIDLKNYLLQGNVKNHFLNFQKTGLNSDELLEKYIDGIITEFQMISLRTKNAIFENEILSKNSEKFWNLSSLKQIN